MSHTAAKWIFWSGTLLSLALFLALTADTSRQFAQLTHADKLDDHVVAGKRVFERHNCNDCHTILGFGSYYAPDLTRVYYRIGDAAIMRRLQQPELTFANDFRKMPQQHLSDQEISDTVSYLQWVSNIENHDWPPQDSKTRWQSSTERTVAAAALSPSAALIQQENCLVCHTVGTQGESRGPRFEWIGARRSSTWIAAYLADPQKIAPGSPMPDYARLPQGQRQMVGEFITSLAGTGEK